MPGCIALALLMAATAGISAHVRLDPNDGAILPADIAKELLKQCSREAPHDVTGMWIPKGRDIRELEARLPAALEAMALQRGNQFAQLTNFQRQYAGFVIHDRKIVYVNAFPHGTGDPDPKATLPWRRTFDWHRNIIQVCDGGPAFFGVEYDPAKKSFDHFEFNGIP